MKRYVSEVLPRYVTHTRHGPRRWLDYRTLDSFGRKLSLHLHFPKRYSDILRSYSIYSIHRSAAPIQPHLRSQWRIAINKSSADTAMFITALAGDESTRRSFRCCPRTDQTLTPHQLGGSGSQQGCLRLRSSSRVVRTSQVRCCVLMRRRPLFQRVTGRRLGSVRCAGCA